MLAAILLQTVYFVVFAGSYQAAFQTVGIRTRTRDLIPPTLGSLFVNLVVPVGGAGGGALFVEDLSRRGKSAAGVATGVVLQLMADISALTVLLIPGMAYLLLERDLKVYQIGAAVVLFLLIAGLSSILLIGVWRPQWLYRLLSWSRGTANWLFGRLKRSLALADDWAQNDPEEFGRAAAAVASQPFGLIRTVAIALMAHLVNLASLYCLFLAFHRHVGLGTVVAGYAVGILFWIVSITPQGIGVVEGFMALTFTSLGVPGAVAATVAIAFRGLTFWIPMLLGFLAIQRLRVVGTSRSFAHRDVGSAHCGRPGRLDGRDQRAVGGDAVAFPAPSEAGAVFAARGTTRGPPYGGAFRIRLAHVGGKPGAAKACSVAARSRGARYFGGESPRQGTGLRRSHAGYGADGDALADARSLPRQVGPAVRVAGRASTGRGGPVHDGLRSQRILTARPTLQRALRFLVRVEPNLVMFTQFYDPGLMPLTRFGRFFANSIYTVGAVTFGYAGLMLLRPVFFREAATAEERARAAEIVVKHGRSSIARYALFDDKRYYFTAGGSVIAYVQIGRTAVTLGDPIGPDDDVLPSIKGFASLCQHNDWLPVFYQTRPETLQLYKKAGLDAISVGEEGVVNLRTFTLEGKEGKPLRSPVNKLTNAGYRFDVHQPPIPDALLEELRSISDEWLTMMHGSEKRFSLGWFDDAYIRSSPIGAVYGPDDRIRAFVNFVPEYQLNEISVDLMRRRSEMENGTMEFLFVSLFEWARAQGYESFNLGLSSLAGLGEKPEDPTIERVMHWIYEHVNQFYNFKGLHEFKVKFHPQWSPRYLIYAGGANLVQSWVAVVQANSGGTASLLGYFGRKREPSQLSSRSQAA